MDSDDDISLYDWAAEIEELLNSEDFVEQQQQQQQQQGLFG